MDLRSKFLLLIVRRRHKSPQAGFPSLAPAPSGKPSGNIAKTFARFLPSLVLPGILCCAARADDDAQKSWRIASGGNVLEVRQRDGIVSIAGLGPARQGNPVEMPLVSASIGGDAVLPRDLALSGVETTRNGDGTESLHLALKHPAKAVEFLVKYTAFGDTGTFGVDIGVRNAGREKVAVDRCASLCLQTVGAAPAVRYLEAVHNYLGNRQAIERNYRSVIVDGKPFKLGSEGSGRATSHYASWWSLFDPGSDTAYTAQLVYSGNWQATFTPDETTGTCRVAYEMTFDNGGPMELSPGASFSMPRAIVLVTPTDDLSNCVTGLHRFQRAYAIPRQPANDPPLVQYNTWYSLAGSLNSHKEISKLIPLAARIGCEAFVIDANWHYCPNGKTNRWSESLGDWVINPERFPKGLAPVIKEVHKRGMKFGLWFEPEVASPSSDTFRNHPDWFLTFEGKPVFKHGRYHLDYSKPEVRAWMTSIIDRTMREGKIDWIKLDYNINVGDQFDSTDGNVTNTRLHNHLQGYYQWLDELVGKYPDLIIEHCASGGYRADLGILSHTHTGWISDSTNPRYSLQLAWGALVDMPPETCNHWMTGDVDPKAQSGGKTTITTTDPGWWDFMLRVPMNGQYGISSRLDDWPAAALDRAKENIALYKRIRKVIGGGDVYHLTGCPQVGYEPTGWMGIQYVRPSLNRSVLLCYRLGKSDKQHRFMLRGLEPHKKYRIAIDGKRGETRLGGDLMRNGLSVGLDREWLSRVIELNEEK